MQKRGKTELLYGREDGVLNRVLIPVIFIQNGMYLIQGKKKCNMESFNDCDIRPTFL